MEARAAGLPVGSMQRWLAEPPRYLSLLPSASVSCDVQRGAGDIITLCLFSGPFCDGARAVVDCKMISGTEAALCRRCI